MLKWLLIKYTHVVVALVATLVLITSTLLLSGLLQRYTDVRKDASDRVGVTKLQQIGLQALRSRQEITLTGTSLSGGTHPNNG